MRRQDLSSHGTEKDRTETRELLDWTRKGPLPEAAPKRGSDRPFSGQRGPDYSPDLAGDRSRRPAFEQGEAKQRDFSNWERKGPLTPTAPPATGGVRSADRPTSHDGPRERRNSPAWGEGRSQDGSRPPRREFSERPAPERVPTAAELDNQWRSKMRPDPPPVTTNTPPKTESKAPPSPAPVPAPPTVRPKLNLQKRTVSQAETSPALQSGSSDAKASPFGGARPIDTAAREKEIGEKIKQRKEQEDKAREDKRLIEEKAKEKRATKDSGKADQRPEKGKSKANGQSKEGDTNENKGNNYQILRRHAVDNGSDVGNEKELLNTSIQPEGDKNINPQEVVRDANGVSTEATTDEQLQEEGWSTVSKPSKGRRGGNSGARAIAS